MEDEYQEEIESLKKHLSRQREELKVLQELTDQSSLISELRHRVSISITESHQLCCYLAPQAFIVYPYPAIPLLRQAMVRVLCDPIPPDLTHDRQ